MKFFSAAQWAAGRERRRNPGKRAWYRSANHDVERAAVKALFGKVRLPGRVLIIAPSGSFAAIAKKLKAVPNALILARQAQK